MGEHRLRVFQNMMLWNISWPKRDDVTEWWKRVHNEEFYDLSSPNVFFFKRFIAQKISEIHRVTKLRNCSCNQFALVVPYRVSDRECTVLGSYEYSSKKQVQRKNTAAVG